MADDELLASILAHVGELLERGEGVDVDSLVCENPELAGPVRRALAAERLLGAAFPPADAPTAQVPPVIGPYRVLSRLGSGGMGTVYLAETREAVVGCEPGERVALKLLHPHLLERPGFFKRFLREADAGRSVEHPHVVRTLDADAVRAGGDTVHFLVMEYVEGQTLADLLAEHTVVPETLLREIARQMADGLSAIHDAGLIHRDLKPENALITTDHVVRLMDLGVARPLSSDDQLTQQGAFAGSLPYAAPEQFGDGEVTAASDLYSLGVTLYELATGSSPFQRDGFAAVMAAHREHVPPTVRDVVPEMSAFFSDVVGTLLAKQPERRFESAAGLAAVLADGAQSDWWREREQSRPRETALPQVPVRRETALHGRDAYLALLREAWESAATGTGQMVLLEGEAGIGKTRLVDAFLRDVGASDVHVLYGSYPPTGGLGGISDAVVAHFGEHGLESALAPYLTITPSLVPSIAAVVQHRPPPDGAASLTPTSIQTVLVHLMRALATEKPLVWVVDDVHFADEESRGVLLSMARAVTGHRVLLLATARPGLPEDWLAHLGRVEACRRHTLARLSAREVILLLQDAFKSDLLADKLGARIALKSDGIPFFVFEMIRGLREGQFLTQLADGTWAETKVVEQIEVPSAVRDLIEVRLRGLPREQRALLDLGAVHGFVFDPDLAARVLGRSKLAVLQDLADLERRSGIVHGEHGTCRFDHHQLQEVLYGNLPPDLRIEYHAALAEALEVRAGAVDSDAESVDGALCVELCTHFIEGRRGKQALRYLPVAQAHLEKSCLYAEFAALTGRALARPGLLAGTDRAQALLRVADAFDAMGDRAQQEERVREAERLAEELDDNEIRLHAARARGNLLWRTSRQDEALSAHRRYLHLARERGDRRREAYAMGNLGSSLASLGRLSEAEEQYRQQLAVCAEMEDRPGVASVAGNLGVLLWQRGNLPEAKTHIEQSLALSRESGDRRGEATATGNLGLVFHSEGRLREAEAQYEQALVLRRQLGQRSGEATSMGCLGAVFWSQGRMREAGEYHERHLRLARELGDREGEALALSNLGIGLRGVGESAAGEQRLVECLDLCEEIGYRWAAAITQRALGSLRVAANDLTGGRASLTAARDLARDVGLAGVETLARCELACLQGGDAVDACEAFAKNDARLTAEERREARWLLWTATGDRAHLEEAKRLLEEALSLVPDEYHESMCRNVRVNREIMAAWNDHCCGDSAGRGAESPTRAG